MATTRTPLEDFLQPLSVSIPKVHRLARSFCTTYTRLAAESQDQFLPTPVSDSVLRPAGSDEGRYLAIDFGGTNLRVGFIELSGPDGSSKAGEDEPSHAQNGNASRVRRLLDKSWPIGEMLKKTRGEDLFGWIGACMVEVIRDAWEAWPEELPDPVPMGLTFSFPMFQRTLSDATVMAMGKGFATDANLDLAKQLRIGYERKRQADLPGIEIVAICNDTSATLVSFAYQMKVVPRRKAAMALIVGTGCNATIPLALSKLHPKKRPAQLKVLDDSEALSDPKITVNTEWTINGAALPLHELQFITDWDRTLDAECDNPGFQPFEFMTAGRYLGELGRIIAVEYFTKHLKIPKTSLPHKLQEQYALPTTFLGKLRHSLSQPSALTQLETELPASTGPDAWQWTTEAADALYHIAKAVQVRAAGMVAAATIGLLACADEIRFSPDSTREAVNGEAAPMATLERDVDELLVGYTGGCIVHFQDYRDDCQAFLDAIMEMEFGHSPVPRVVLEPCHDGGIIGAGILAGTVKTFGHDVSR